MRTCKNIALALLAVLALLGVSPARADIANGGVESGSVTGTGTQDFYFNGVANQVVKVGMGVPTPDAKFYSSFSVYKPDTTSLFSGGGGANSYGGRSGATLPTTGRYKITAKNVFGSSYPSFVANFTINVALTGQSDSGAHGSGSGVLIPGATASPGTLALANTDIWPMAANSGDGLHVTMTAGTGFSTNPGLNIYKPDGTAGAGAGGASPLTLNYTKTLALIIMNTPGCQNFEPITFVSCDTAVPDENGKTLIQKVHDELRDTYKQDRQLSGATAGVWIDDDGYVGVFPEKKDSNGNVILPKTPDKLHPGHFENISPPAKAK